MEDNRRVVSEVILAHDKLKMIRSRIAIRRLVLK
jgi:hypothetical protein